MTSFRPDQTNPEYDFALVQTRDLHEFDSLTEELTPELGERFPSSMKNWCGIGKRPYALPFWQVYIVKWNGGTVGISGLYQRHEDPAQRCWIGWLGVRPAYRRHGIARRTVGELKRIALEFGFKELWVHTHPSNQASVTLYRSEDFESMNGVYFSTRGRSSDPDGAVFRFRLEDMTA